MNILLKSDENLRKKRNPGFQRLNGSLREQESSYGIRSAEYYIISKIKSQ
jgi:hypothetical protein